MNSLKQVFSKHHYHVVYWVLVFTVCFGIMAISSKTKNTEERYPLYNEQDAVIQLPVMFTLNHNLVSDVTDMTGYCLSVKNRDVECYTMQGRFLGVGDGPSCYDGNESSVFTMDVAPEQYRRVMINAFQRVWAD